MATQQTGQSSSGGSNGFLYFVVGALVVAVALLGYIYIKGHSVTETPADKVGDAAKDLGSAAKQATRNLNPPTAPAPRPVQPTAPTTLPPS